MAKAPKPQRFSARTKIGDIRFLKRKSTSWLSFTAWLAFGVAFVVLDQVLKVWIQAHLFENEFIPITTFFNLCYVRNTGAAFSLLSESNGWQMLFFVGTATVAMVVTVVWIKLVARPSIQCGAALIFSGALGNTIDRLMLGSIVDFIDFHIGHFHWPAFNVADIAICFGATVLLWAQCRKKIPTQ